MDFSQFQGPSKEWEAFIQEHPLPPTNVNLPPRTIRQATNALRVRIAQDELATDDLLGRIRRTDYSILSRDFTNVIARVYRPKDVPADELLPTYLYFHGGGHLLGTIETEDAACSRLAINAKIAVVNVNYRHTPEFTHPYQFNDAWDSFDWLAKNATRIGCDPSRVIVGGISAGAGLAASIVLRHKDQLQEGQSSSVELKIVGQLLCIPWLIHPDNHPYKNSPIASYQQNVDAAVLPQSLFGLFTKLLDAKDPTDPLLNAALVDVESLTGLPKTSLMVAGQDLLRDEGLLYAEKLKKSGVSTKVHVFPGLPHGFRRFSNLPSSTRWDDILVEACRWSLSADNSSSFTVEET